MGKSFYIKALAVASVTALISGCASRPSEPSRIPSSRTPVARVPGGAAASAAAYVATAASIDLFEVRSGELAQRRAASAKLRNFASMMVNAHRGTAAQLSLAGRRLNLLPEAALLPRHQAMLDQLAASANFDAAYQRAQNAVHDEAWRLHSIYAARGASPTLKPVAANAAPIERRHIDMLKRL